MLLRTVVSFIALPILIFALYFSPPWVLPILLAVIVMLAIYELLISTGIVKNRTLLILTELFGVLIVPWVYFGGNVNFALMYMFVFAVVLFAVAMSDRKSVGFAQITGCFFAAAFLSVMFTAILRIRSMEGGIFFVLLPFLTAWMTDTGAYFTGYFFGKHKFAPSISPKKTIEGCVGGLVSCIVFILIYGAIVNRIWNAGLSMWLLGAIGLFCSVIAQFGDLSLSFIKREFGIKDYGTIMPGHGGILDRFDSVLFTAPAVELMLKIAMELL
ncbi:MAG: phosphatidate cytidylyltransferase [Clostridiales bacterium]|nr:phosphatidate cytidylyltransferase [Clostridiales bacterium]